MNEASTRQLVDGASAGFGLGDYEIKLLTEVTLIIGRMHSETARFGKGFQAFMDNPAVHFGVPETAHGKKRQEKLRQALETVLQDLQQHGPTLAMIGEGSIGPIANYLAIMRWQDSAPPKKRKIRQAWLQRTQTTVRDFPLQQMLYAMQTVFGNDFTAKRSGEPARLTSQLLRIAGIGKTPEEVAFGWLRLLSDANVQTVRPEIGKALPQV